MGELTPGQQSGTNRMPVILARVLVMYLFGLGFGPWKINLTDFPYLPFIAALDLIPSWIFGMVTGGIFWVSSTCILINFRVRLFSFLLGTAVLALIFSSKPLYSSSLVFASCLLIINSLKSESNWLPRIQLSVVYFGAGINKWLDPDWWNGSFFYFFGTDVFHLPYFQEMSSWCPNQLMLSQILGIMTLFMELALGMMFLLLRSTTIPIITGLVFHGAILVWTSGQLSVLYFYLMGTAYLMVSPSANTLTSGVFAERKILSSLLRKYSFKPGEFKGGTTIGLNSYAREFTSLLFSYETAIYTYFLGIILLRRLIL